VRSIYRPHICGEAVDFDDTGDRILTGAYLKENPLQIWNFGTGNLIETLPWSMSEDKAPCMLYAAQFSHGKSNNKFIVAGGGGAVNEAKIFNTSLKKVRIEKQYDKESMLWLYSRVIAGCLLFVNV
jgi:hypothetical protein